MSLKSPRPRRDVLRKAGVGVGGVGRGILIVFLYFRGRYSVGRGLG
jgi:hypothetical protein